MVICARTAAVLACLVLVASTAVAQPCGDRLSRAYGIGTLMGGAKCAALFDGGSGPVLHIGGSLRVGSQQACVVKLVGGHWVRETALSGTVTSMAAIDDGAGPALYVGGVFTVAPSTNTVNVARWDGTEWAALPAIPYQLIDGTVRCLAWHDDGSGPKLYVGGSFTGPLGASCIARWDGLEWSSLPIETAAQVRVVRTMLAHDDGTGRKLYVGGSFMSAGGVPVTGLASWDGASWAAVGPGFASGASQPDIFALVVHDDGAGPALYAGGVINLPDRHSGSSPVAMWRNGVWSRVLAIGQGLTSSAGASALISLDDGTGPALYAATGSLVEGSNQVRRFREGAWTLVGSAFVLPTSVAFSGVHGFVHLPGNDQLVAFGDIAFNAAPNTDLPPVVAWNGGLWLSVEHDALGVQDIPTVVSDPGCTDGRLYALGQVLTTAGWSPDLGGDPYPANGFVRAPINGNQTTLTSNAEGVWIKAHGEWQAFPSPGPVVTKLVTADDGSGSAVFAVVGGSWSDGNGGTITGVRIEEWTGTGWAFVGPALTQGTFISSLAWYDDGGGRHLYIAGRFNAMGSNATPFVARLLGQDWIPIEGVDGPVNDMLVFDVGSGPELIFAGDFSSTAGLTANGIARWNGTRIAAIGGGLGGLAARGKVLRVFDDGRGPRLWAGSALGSGLVYWTGTTWAVPVSLIGLWFPTVTSLAEVNKPDGTRSLFIGGVFTSANNVPCNNIAELVVCRHTCEADFDGDTAPATDQDIEAFFACLAGNCCVTCASSDFNNDGDSGTDADIESFFRVLAGGAC